MADTFDCPSCGAPLEVEGDTETIHCKYCNETVIVPENLRRSHPSEQVQKIFETVSQTQTRATTTQVVVNLDQGKTQKNNVFLPVFVVILLLAVLIFGGFYFFYQSNNPILSQVFKPDVRVDNSLVVMPGTDSNTPDLLIPVSDNGSDVHQFYYVDGKTHTMLWHSEDLSDQYSQAQALATDKQIYILDQANLSALDRFSGKLIWKTTLDNGVGYCKDCIGVYGGTLALVLKDGTIQGVEASSGKLTWHKTLNTINNHLLTADGKPAVLDKGDADTYVVYIFEPVTGKIDQTLTPTCKVDGDNHYTDEIQVSDDGNSMTLLYDDCIQRISLPDGKVLSQSIASQDEKIKPNAWFATKYLITQDTIYYTNNGSDEPIDQVQFTNWNGSHLIQDKKYSLIPKFVIQNVLVNEAEPSFDSEQHEYWGIDTKSGQRLWQYALKGEGRISFYDAHPTSNGIFIVQCREDPDGCTWAMIDAKTGVGSNSGKGPGGPFIEPAWGKNTFYLGANSVLTAINMSSGKTLFQWP